MHRTTAAPVKLTMVGPARMTHPVAGRRRYDRIVEAIHRSNRHGRGEGGRCGRAGRDPG